VPNSKKGDKADYSNYTGLSPLSPTYTILSNILLSRLTPYAEEITEDHQCGFRCNSSTTGHTSCIHQILEKKQEDIEAVYQIFIDFKKAYDSVRREVLYNILNEFGIPMKLARLRQTSLKETNGRVRVGKHLFDMLPIRNGLKQGDALTPLLFNFALQYANKRVQINQDGLKLNCTHRLLVCADEVNILGESVHITDKNTALVVTTKETDLQVNADKTKNMPRAQIRVQDKVTIQRVTTVFSKGWNSSNIWEPP
jgi:sorting nexin-29